MPKWFIFIHNYMNNGIVLDDFDNTRSFTLSWLGDLYWWTKIWLVSVVFWIVWVWKYRTVFWNIVRPVIFITSNIKCCKFYEERVGKMDKRLRQKDGWISYSFSCKSCQIFGTVAKDNWISVLCLGQDLKVLYCKYNLSFAS